MGLSRRIFIPLLLVFIFSFAISTQVLAIDASGAKLRLQELRNNRQGQVVKEIRENKQAEIEKLKMRRDELKNKEATKRAEVKQKVAQKIKDLLLRSVVHQEKTFERLDKIAEKIASRIDKLKEKGVNTKIAESKLVLAESEATGAASAIAISRSTVEALGPASLDKASVEVAKEVLKASKKELFGYHKALVVALVELKASKASKEGTSAATQ